MPPLLTYVLVLMVVSQALFLQFAADTVGLVSFGKDLNSLE